MEELIISTIFFGSSAFTSTVEDTVKVLKMWIKNMETKILQWESETSSDYCGNLTQRAIVEITNSRHKTVEAN